MLGYREDLSANTIRECDRDVLSFHWVDSLESKVIEIRRFTRLAFGLTQYPFLLEGTLEGTLQGQL